MDSFTLVARTDSKTSIPSKVKVNILQVNDETPQLVNNTGLKVWAGSITHLGNEQLGKTIKLQSFYSTFS